MGEALVSLGPQGGGVHPLFRTRTGTGALYADNRERQLPVGQSQRRSRHLRLPNRGRMWALEEGPPPAVDLAALQSRTRSIASEMLLMMRDVGALITLCLRRREPLPAGFLLHEHEALGWYLVLYTIGLLDRQGHWLGPALGTDP